MTKEGLQRLLNSRNNCAEKVGWTFVHHYDRDRLMQDIIAMVPLMKWDAEETTRTDELPG
jgi:hypothetical protein